MKVAQQQSTTLIQGKVESVEMTLSKRGVIQAVRMFRDQIYTHKAWAVVREIIANAVDEHERHSVSRPVLVTLPTMEDPHFRVRDFAKGLPKEKVFSVFFQYFESTKGNSNDDIGGFGIGAKSPLAYAQMFFVDSCHGGSKTSYVANINGEASTAHKMDLQDSNETGIEVVVPVEASDFRKFQELTAELLHFSGFDVEIANDFELAYPDSQWTIQNAIGKVGFSRSQFKSTSRIYANIKGIMYVVDNSNDIKNPFYNDTMLFFTGEDEIEIHPSRERIELTKRNIVKINNAMEALQAEVVKEISAKMANVTCARDRFAIETGAGVFRSSSTLANAGLNKLIPEKFLVSSKGASLVTWNALENKRVSLRSTIRYPDRQIAFEPNGFSATYSSHYRKAGFVEKLSLLIVPSDEVLRQEYVIACAEKLNIPQPILCIKDQVAPALWIEGKDFWRMSSTAITKDEAKAVRDRYSIPRAVRVKNALPIVKSGEVLGYSSTARSHHNAKTLAKLQTQQANGEKFLLVSMDETSTKKAVLQCYSKVISGMTPIFVFSSRFSLWKASGLKYEIFDSSFEKRCQAFLSGNARLKLKNNFSHAFAGDCSNEKKYLPFERDHDRIEGEIKMLFPQIQIVPDANLVALWDAAQIRFDSLTKLEKELLRMSNERSFYGDYPTMKAEIKRIKELIFV